MTRNWASGRCRSSSIKIIPMGHPDRGTAQGLKAITLDDVKEFHRRHYTRKAINLGMAGGFDDSTPRIEEGFAGLPQAEPIIPKLPAPRMANGLEITIVENLLTRRPSQSVFPSS